MAARRAVRTKEVLLLRSCQASRTEASVNCLMCLSRCRVTIIPEISEIDPNVVVAGPVDPLQLSVKRVIALKDQRIAGLQDVEKLS